MITQEQVRTKLIEKLVQGQQQYIAKQINLECEVDNIDGVQMCVYYDDQTVDVDIIDGQSDLKF